jgi:glycosyltransferase involved in cell wall biosynthesis
MDAQERGNGLIDISVVLPVYRTANVTRELYERLTSVLEDVTARFELIFVDDASPDSASAILRELSESDYRVRVVTHARNLGQQLAVRNGLAVSRGDVVLIMDADLQDPPEAIPALLKQLGSGSSHAVFAGRRGRYQHSSRMITSRGFKRLMHAMCGVPPDAGSYVAMTRVMADSVLGLPEKWPYMLALIGSTGLHTHSIPVDRNTRPIGESAYSEWGRIRFACSGLAAAMWLKWWRWRHKQTPDTMRRSGSTTASR